MTSETPVAKKSLNDYAPPPDQRRKGSFIVRMALRRIPSAQDPRALKAASRMVLALPLIQGVLLVGVLKAEMWMALLSVEGLLISWLAANQLSRPTPESKLTGFAIALLNAVLLGGAGLFLGSNVYWLTGIIGLVPVLVLVFRRTRKSTVKLAWAAYALPALLLFAGSGLGRLALESSESETDPHARLGKLNVAWYALQLRGDNGCERALFRLRQAQAAFNAGDYNAAYALADDGLYDGERNMRTMPVSIISGDLIESLSAVKAQSYYNAHWGKEGQIYQPIKPEPLDEESKSDKNAPILWGW